ncbi:MAG: histidine phosphatase family protein [Alphaproteobacteria bacterium]
MRVLHLLRHARSAPEDDGTKDRLRPLSRPGRDDARLVAASLPAALGAVDLVLCSTALRTRETASLVLAGFTAPPPVIFEDGLYLAALPELIRRLRRLDEAVREAMLIGHNPGLHELALELAAADSPFYPALVEGRFPTATRASFAIETGWTGIGRSRHALRDYVTPKSLRASG